jgi:hypothetical protein
MRQSPGYSGPAAANAIAFAADEPDRDGVTPTLASLHSNSVRAAGSEFSNTVIYCSSSSRA